MPTSGTEPSQSFSNAVTLASGLKPAVDASSMAPSSASLSHWRDSCCELKPRSSHTAHQSRR